MSFPHGALRNLLRDIAAGGYRFGQFGAESGERTILLRHDIDFSLQSALDAARIEAELGISATYFFMLSSNFYNLLSPGSRNLVREIAALGHTISLHYDPTAHDDIDEGFALERRAFEDLFKVQIGVVSLHRPQGFLEDNNRPLPGVMHTYEDRFFRDMQYISDSRGSFNFGHPLDSKAFKTGRPIHLLLHPIWWVGGSGTPSETLRQWQRQHHQFLSAEVGRNCAAYDGISPFQDPGP